MSKEPEYLQKRLPQDEASQNAQMEGYYRFQAMIYDSTRWTFLFGRNALIGALPFSREDQPVILEVGCGTGYNLKRLQQAYPKAHLIGLDVSSTMVEKAGRKFPKTNNPEFHCKPYSPDDDSFAGRLDAIIFSYSLTMINPQWNDLVMKAKEDLKPGGVIGVVDFHYSPHQWFRTHMANNHVKMEKHILPLLQQEFKPLVQKVGKAYFGIWQYFLFVGKK